MTGGIARGLCFAAMAVALTAPAPAKAPRPADEAAVREIVRGIYAGYSKPFDVLFPERSDDAAAPELEAFKEAVDGYDIPYTTSFRALIDRWEAQLGDELRTMNGFDWYCQCQDFDPASAKMLSERYLIQGANGIRARLLFAPTGSPGSKIMLEFVRENGQWAIDDIEFDDRSTARKLLEQDMKDIAEQAGKPAS